MEISHLKRLTRFSLGISVLLPTFWKGVHRKNLSCTKFHGFQARWANYGHNHDIVCSNNPILCTCVQLGMANNIDLGCFNFRGIKSSFFIFLVPKLGFLWSIYHKYVSKIYHQNFRKYYIIFYAQFTSSLHGNFILVTHKEIDKYLPIQLKAGQIWTTGAS
jgi:hypothetical protein